ncbi:MAG TPA: type I polyketide synthase [Pyrinomonadaceae bacterium]|nr:type I polyketide synthase [Pyrinomonadaceae bacterium]
MSAFADEIAKLSQKRLALLCMELKEQLDSLSEQRHEPVAIIGMGCRFPGGADHPKAFWRLLRDGVDAIGEVPSGRWDIDSYFDPDPDAPGKMYTREGGFIEQVDLFDAQFFGISPKEATRMDPQQRLLLEVSWEALEHAGWPPDKLKGSRTGIFVGIGIDDYAKVQFRTGNPALVDAYTGPGNAFCFAAGRLSYLLGLHGPSIALDTACSTSLVAVHLACQSLRSGECSLALAGGVNLMLAPEPTVFLSKARALSPDGRCKTFDAAADGYGRGEGCGMVVLKRLSDAIADRDNILAVIRGSAVNHDGPSSGLTVPNGDAQQAVIREALINARVESHQVNYLEAHGTGTSLGDPIEIRAVEAVLGGRGQSYPPLLIGSVKTNIGHLEVAAGVASLIKVVLALQHEQIPGSLHFHHANPNIKFSETSVRVATALTDWRVNSTPRVAGISSFGLSGTNAHMVVEEAPETPTRLEDQPEPSAEGPYLLPLSARSTTSLFSLVQSYRDCLSAEPLPLRDVCYTASVRRSHYEYRLALVAGSIDEACEQLSLFSREKLATTERVYADRCPKLVFVLSGHGTQWWGAGQELLQREPVFLETLKRCDEALRRYIGWSVLDRLASNESPSSIAEIEVEEPVFFALQVALAALWESWGVKPDVVVGHSLGEVAAAHIAGVLDLDTAARVIFHRGLFIQRTTGSGLMVAVQLPSVELLPMLEEYQHQLSIAAVNSPVSTVVSGTAEAFDELIHRLRERGVLCRLLPVTHAFHNQRSESPNGELSRALGEFKPKAAAIPIFSTVSGKSEAGESFDAHYWERNITAPVRFADAMSELVTTGHRIFLEISPHPNLRLPMSQCLEHYGQQGTVLATLRRGQGEQLAMLRSLGTLYKLGYPVKWEGLYRGDERHINLPTYPWERQRYWIETDKVQLGNANTAEYKSQTRTSRPLLGQRLLSPVFDGIVFESKLREDSLAFLKDHRIYETPLLPATGFIEIAQSAASEAFGFDACVVEDLVIHEPLILPTDEFKTVQTVLKQTSAHEASFQSFSYRAAEPNGEPSWQLHASARLNLREAQFEKAPVDQSTLPQLQTQAQSQEQVSVEEFYAEMRRRGLQFGPTFQGIERLWRRNGKAFGSIQLPKSLDPADGHGVHPALLDACFHLFAATLSEREAKNDEGYLPISLKRYSLYRRPGRHVWAEAVRNPNTNQDTLSGNICLFDESGEVLAEVEGLYFRLGSSEILHQADKRYLNDCLFEIQWQQSPLLNPESKATKQTGSWLIFTDASGVGTTLANLLEQRGEHCVTVTANEDDKNIEGKHWNIDPESPEDFQRLIRDVIKQRNDWAGIIHLWGLDVGPITDSTTTFLPSAQALSCGSVLLLLQALSKVGVSQAPRLWICTRGSQLVSSGSDAVALAQAPLWGLARVIGLEHPEVSCTSVDLDPLGDDNEVQLLYYELRASTSENQIAFRGHGRYVPRLSRRARATGKRLDIPAGESYQLEVQTRGVLDNLSIRGTERRRPGKGEVEVRVRATGLSFKDVLNVLGMYPGDAGPLGAECAGTVVSVGEGVEGLKVGTEVIALAPASFSKYITTPAAFVVVKPERYSLEEAATIPIAFLTAYYALFHLARIKAGDRILIHAAAGGVGLAAVQLAQKAGAVIFGTAGNHRKRNFLKSIGVQYVMDSRSLCFADEILSQTDGKGVDIVLNSLAGEFIHKSFSVLQAHGRFIEIGKNDILNKDEAAKLRNDVTYHVVDLQYLFTESSDSISSMFHQLSGAFSKGTLRPLPKRVFPIQESISAFRYMAQAQHIGKVVVMHEERTQQSKSRLHSDSTYLITGGLGSIGLQVASWMVEKGACHLVLLGRSAGSLEAQKIVKEMEQAGAQVVIASADVSNAEDLRRVFDNIKESMPPLRGIVHAAGVLDDSVLQQLTWDRFIPVMAGKMQGAWNLHTFSRNVPLDFFIMFSSVASVFGSPAQGNYAAANAFVDALAHYRRSQELPAMAINWGPWANAGFAERLGSRGERRWAAQGVGMIPPRKGLQILEYLLVNDITQVTALSIDWARFAQQFPSNQPIPFFSEVVRELAATHGPTRESAAQNAEFLSQLKQARPDEVRDLVISFLQDQLAQLLGFNKSYRPDPKQSMLEMGMDSLTAVDFRNRLYAALGQPLSPTTVFDYPTIEVLADYLVRDVLRDVLLLEQPAELTTDAHDEDLAAVLDRLEQLSEEQAQAFLTTKLMERRTR